MSTFSQAAAQDECEAIIGRSYGVIDELFKEIVDWATSQDYIGLGKEALDQAYHWVIEWLLPRLLAKAPQSIHVVMTPILILLQKIHDAYLPHA